MKSKQLTYCYCKCGTELIKAADISCINDVYVEVNGVLRNIVHFNCPNCRMDNYFDFDFPAPIPLPLNDKDEIIEVYLERHINAKPVKSCNGCLTLQSTDHYFKHMECRDCLNFNRYRK